jgi:hypothetical protein
VRLTFEGVYELMSEDYIVWLQDKEDLHVHNISHGTVITQTATNVILEIFLRTSFVKTIFTRDDV